MANQPSIDLLATFARFRRDQKSRRMIQSPPRRLAFCPLASITLSGGHAQSSFAPFAVSGTFGVGDHLPGRFVEQLRMKV